MFGSSISSQSIMYDSNLKTINIICALSILADAWYQKASCPIMDEDLKLEYFIETDLISEEQKTHGLDKFEEVFTKQWKLTLISINYTL